MRVSIERLLPLAVLMSATHLSAQGPPVIGAWDTPFSHDNVSRLQNTTSRRRRTPSTHREGGTCCSP